MASSSSMFRLAALVAAIVVLISSSEAQNQISSVSCSDVVRVLAPCAQYLKDNNSNAKPSQACCIGVKNLDDQAKSKQDRVDVCNCIKKVLSGVGSYDPNRIPQLPKDCGFSFTLPPIDKNTDCSRVMMMM